MALLDELVDALTCLPSVGQKSAQRMAMHLLDRDRKGAKHLSEKLSSAAEKIGNCQLCRSFTEDKLCRLCANPNRDDALICVVETPMDVLAIEQSASFNGKYFVLMGHLSPLDGVGASDLDLDMLQNRLQSGKIHEIILATNATVEGEATAQYIKTMAEISDVLVTRIAQGVPLGGELDYMDKGTLSHALAGRTLF